MLNFEIKLLANCPEFIPDIARLWFNEIGQQWVPNATIAQKEQDYKAHLNKNNLPLTFVAIQENKLIGTGSLRHNDGIRNDLTPWLGGLIVHPYYRQQKIGEKIIESVKQQAKAMGYEKLYLFAFDPTIPKWYAKLGWRVLGHDHFYHHPVVVMEIGV